MTPLTFSALEKAEQQYAAYYKGRGVFLQGKRFFRYPGKYIMRGMSRLGLLPSDSVTKARTFWGKDMYMLLADSNAGPLYYFGFLPRRELRLTKFLLQTLKSGDIFYDIGANYGFYTALANAVIRRGQVHAFEPHPKVFSCLQKTMGKDERVFLNQIALSDTEGSIQFFDAYQGNHSGGSTLLEEVASQNPEAYKAIEVQTATLNAYAKTHSTPMVMKVDVEGAESRFLRGGAAVIRKSRPAIAMECWGGGLWEEYSQNAVKLILGWGYKAHTLDEEGRAQAADPMRLKELVGSYDNLVFLPL